MRRSWTTSWLAFTAAALCAAGMVGCNSFQTSGIDPTGEHVFTPPPPPSSSSPASVNVSNERYFDDPMGQLPWDDVAVLIEPRETVAPVGSQVVLIAGVVGHDGYLRTNRRLEWSVAPGSVGEFVAVEQGTGIDFMLGDFNWPRKINATSAIGSTSRSNVKLNRGTPTPEDDVFVRRGQGWITLTSPIEGTSHVTVVAPEVYNWDARVKSATVHWVDAAPQYPPPAINPAGTKHVFTTTVTRHSNQSPCENWLVRYEIVGGPPAGFSPSGAAATEVRTNSAGQACAEIFQKQPASGVNKICIQVVRPADAPGAGGQRLVVGNGTTTKTWSAPDLAARVTGPATANVGATLNYQIEISNPGDLAAKDVTAVVDVPDGLTYLGANPAAEAAGRQLRWRLGDLGARQRRPIEVGFRAERQGSAVVCCDAASAGGLKARECATTTIGSSAAPASPGTPAALLDVSITPAQTTATVGDKLSFEIAVSNRSRTAMTGGVIKVRFDPGLTREKADETMIAKGLPDLSPGETRRFDAAFQVTKPGRLNLSVEVSVPTVAPASAQASVTAVGGSAPAPGATASPLSVAITGPPKPLTVGEKAMFIIEVKNAGSATLQNVKLTALCDPALLVPANATDGWSVDNASLVWNIATLLPGQVAQRKIECTCEAASAKAYTRAAVTSLDGGRVDGQASVEILKAEKPPAPAAPPSTGSTPTTRAGEGLTLSAYGLANPVRPGKELTYEIQVINKGTAPCRQIAVTATAPPGMTPVALGTVGAKIDGQRILFNVAAELAPGKTLTYRARVSVSKPGAYRLRVELAVPGLLKPMQIDSDETEVRD